ncbi:MAG: chromosomal replication initiator protein DnaA [Clostridia bacterium]|nr:chromosomal replication initiator protein DnaA [Clostridia bacterium]
MSYLDEISEIWKLAFKNISANKTRSFANLWFKDLKIQSYNGNTVTFSTDSKFKYDMIKKNHMDILKQAFSDYLPCDIEIIYVGEDSAGEEEKSAETVKPEIKVEAPTVKEEARKTPKHDDIDDGFYQIHNPEYTFDNYIVGNSNKFAHAACTAVAQKPAMDYNPLFIYGPSGLGKTHLICAIVNEIKKRKPDTKVIYINGEDFTNQLIESIAKNDTIRFHNKFRSCDILLIDDIQFIAGKVSTQEEFFHTFNALHQEQKQIILTSDRPPKDIATLEERLRTRFEWGLIADIQPPDLELRLAIFKQKVEQAGINIPDDVLLFLAENLRSNIRQIEGAIKKLSAKSLIMGQVINMELAKSCLNELLGGAEPISTTVDKIFSAVYNKYNVPKEDIKGKKRVKNIIWARQVAIYLIREITELSFPNIGEIVDKDHSTVMYSYDQISKKISSNPLVEIEIKELSKDITG